MGEGAPFFLIAGTCVVESLQMAIDTAGQLKEVCDDLSIPLIYKSSFDKANRSSGASFRGPGMEEGLSVPDLPECDGRESFFEPAKPILDLPTFLELDCSDSFPFSNVQ